MDIHFEKMSFDSFCEFFHNEEVCRTWVFQQKWPNGFKCSKCCHSHAYTILTRRLPLFECASCGYQNSLTAGTVMHNSRTPLMKWILTMYLVSQQDSINAVRLADVIQVTYKTAWLMLHKLRDAMSQVEEEELLSGEVQIHTHVYGLQRCKPTFNRLAHEHPILIGSSHHVGEENSLTHLKLHQLTTPDLDGNLLTKYGAAQFSERHVEQSATITSIVQHYGRTRRIPILHHYVTDTISWMNWKFNGIGGKHLQAYLHEYCYRFNRVVRHQSAFNTLVLTSMLRRYPTYKDLVARDYRRRYEFNSHGLQAA